MVLWMKIMPRFFRLVISAAGALEHRSHVERTSCSLRQIAQAPDLAKVRLTICEPRRCSGRDVSGKRKQAAGES
jgi:hypothetical protein